MPKKQKHARPQKRRVGLENSKDSKDSKGKKGKGHYSTIKMPLEAMVGKSSQSHKKQGVFTRKGQ